MLRQQVLARAELASIVGLLRLQLRLAGEHATAALLTMSLLGPRLQEAGQLAINH